MFERFKLVPQLWRTGRLAFRLVRDSRVPLAAKLVLVATVAYIISPLDIVPDWFPVVGQADDHVLPAMGQMTEFAAVHPGTETMVTEAGSVPYLHGSFSVRSQAQFAARMKAVLRRG